MSRSPGLAGALASVLVSCGAAALYVWSNGWFGSGDLRAMLMWSLPLGLVMWLVFRGPLSRARTPWRYVAFAAIGAFIGAMWALIVALAMGAWIMGFSFPAMLCWVLGGAAGGIAVAWSTQFRSWPIALSFFSLAVVAFLEVNAYVERPAPQIQVVIKPRATPEEINRVWDEVLGRRTGRGAESAMLDGLTGVSETGYEGESVILTATIRKTAGQREKDSLVALIRRSPLVARVDTAQGSAVH